MEKIDKFVLLHYIYSGKTIRDILYYKGRFTTRMIATLRVAYNIIITLIVVK